MNENKYKEIVKSGQEPEYISTSLSSISSIGTENSKNGGSMPFGSAILTDTGSSSNLNNQGITHIIHAVPGPRSSFSNDENFIEAAVKAVQNSIILADRKKFDNLAICFVGGGAYRGICNPEKLAEGIIYGAVSQLQKVNNLGGGISLID